MKLRDIMSRSVIRIHPEEPVEVAARTLAHYNIGALPVCGSDGRLCGIITDRDIVIRCTAAGKNAGRTRVQDVMTCRIVSATSDMDANLAAGLMGREQVRRLPVVENGKLCGMVSLADLAGAQETELEAADALSRISSNVSER